MRTLGRGSLMNRVRKFDTVSVNNETIPSVQKLLGKHDENSVRLASPAAGTFYVWVGLLKCTK